MTHNPRESMHDPSIAHRNEGDFAEPHMLPDDGDLWETGEHMLIIETDAHKEAA